MVLKVFLTKQYLKQHLYCTFHPFHGSVILNIPSQMYGFFLGLRFLIQVQVLSLSQSSPRLVSVPTVKKIAFDKRGHKA